MYNQLKSFIILAETKNVSLAAKKVFLTQPAVTQQIRFLEDQFGVKLIARRGNLMELTPEGKRLYDSSKDLVGGIEGLKEIFSDEIKKEKTLRFSTIDSVTLSILPSAIRRLLSSGKDIKLIPKIESSGLGISDLIKDKIDVALCTLENIPDEIGTELLFHEKMIFIGSQKHKDIKNPKLLFSEPLILFPKNAFVRPLIDKILRSNGIETPAYIETIKTSAIVAFVEAGMGVSVVPAFSVQRDISSGRIFEIPIKTDAKRGVGAAYRRDKPLTAIALQFIKALREEARKY